MRWPRRRSDTKRQLTSIGVSPTSLTLTWEQVRSDQRRAREILHHLEDVRALYDDYHAEFVEAVIASTEGNRAYLGTHIQECDTTELGDQLREIQAAMREFLTKARIYNHTDALFWRALDAMRTRVATAVKAISETFDVVVDGDLARILKEHRRKR